MRGTSLLHQLPVLMCKNFQIKLLMSINTNSIKNHTHPRLLKIWYPSRIQHLEGIIEIIWLEPLLKTNRPILLWLCLYDESIGMPRSVWWWRGWMSWASWWNEWIFNVSSRFGYRESQEVFAKEVCAFGSDLAEDDWRNEIIDYLENPSRKVHRKLR
jgi:hypothetical protein